MPYVCRICLFRSSLYEDILDHFKKAHSGSNHLLCTYCLRIFTPSDARVPGIPLISPTGTSSVPGGGVSTAGLGAGVGQTQVYLQHLRMHQVQHQLRRCPACRLNFTNKSDYQVHRRLDHKAGSSSAAAAEQHLKELQQQQQLEQEQAQAQSQEEHHEQIIESISEHMQEPHNVDEFMVSCSSNGCWYYLHRHALHISTNFTEITWGMQRHKWAWPGILTPCLVLWNQAVWLVVPLRAIIISRIWVSI